MESETFKPRGALPPALRGAVDSLLAEYLRYKEGEQSWSHERVELERQVRDLEEKVGASDTIQNALTKRIHTLELTLQEERKRYEALVSKVKSSDHTELLQFVSAQRPSPVPDRSPAAAPPGSSRSKYKTMPLSSRKQFTSPGRDKLKLMLQQMGYNLPQTPTRPSDSKSKAAETPMTSIFSPIPETQDEGASAPEAVPEATPAAAPVDDLEMTAEEEKAMEEKMAMLGKRGKRMGGKARTPLSEAKPVERVKKSSKSKLRWTPETQADAKAWKPRITLRGQMDAVRSVAMMAEQPGVLSASDDGTVTLWNVMEQSNVHTYYAHASIVTALCFDEPRGIVLTSGNGIVKRWSIPTASQDPFTASEGAEQHLMDTITCHTDLVWSIQTLSTADPRYVAASADGSVSILDPASDAPELLRHEDKCPAALSVSSTDAHDVVVAYTDGSLVRFDLVSKQVVAQCSVPSRPMCLARHDGVLFVGCSDHSIQFVDLGAMHVQEPLLAHADCVSALAVDANGLLASACHEGSIRFWDTKARKCVQDLGPHQTHKRKYDESVFSLQFHPSKPFLCSGGADGLVKIYTQ